MSKRIQVTFTDKQWDLLKKLKGEMGNGDAEVVRNLVIAWLSEKSLISTTVKENIMAKSNR